MSPHQKTWPEPGSKVAKKPNLIITPKKALPFYTKNFLASH